MEGLKKYNRMEIHNHTFFRTAYIHNNVHPEGVRVAIGAYGLVFPTVTYADLLLYIGKMHGDFNKAILERKPSMITTWVRIRMLSHSTTKGDPEN